MTEIQRKEILVETVNKFGRQEWFRDAVIYDSHPNTGEPTLELKVNYVPVFERKTVMDYVLQLAAKFVVVDSRGNPID